MEKKCTKCQVIQPVENFYWRKTRNNYSPKCKPCWGEESKNYNKQNTIKNNISKKYEILLDKLINDYDNKIWLTWNKN